MSEEYTGRITRFDATRGVVIVGERRFHLPDALMANVAAHFYAGQEGAGGAH